MADPAPPRTDASTPDLVRAALVGDLEAFGRLVERYEARVRAVALAAGLDAGEAEDAAQDAFLAAHRELATLRDPASFPSWIIAVARRRALTRARQRVLAPALRDDLGRLPLADRREGPPEAAAREALRADVRRALDGLDDRSRLALVLRHHAGLTYAEIAEALTVPVPTIKGVLWRGTLALRARLAGVATEGREA